MPKFLTQKEVDDLLKALADAPVVSFSREEKMMNINIIRKGIYPIPQEVKKCPVCGCFSHDYTLENIQYANPVKQQMNTPCSFDFAQKYPTFRCDRCRTIWQYLGEKEEEKE